METELEVDPDALAAYHIVLASLKHPETHQNERMHLLTRTQIEWVLSQLGAHASAQPVQWEATHAWVELHRQGRSVSLYFPIKQSRHEQQKEAAATSEDDDGFTRERL
jgi:hypothetical protein